MDFLVDYLSEKRAYALDKINNASDRGDVIMYDTSYLKRSIIIASSTLLTFILCVGCSENGDTGSVDQGKSKQNSTNTDQTTSAYDVDISHEEYLHPSSDDPNAYDIYSRTMKNKYITLHVGVPYQQVFSDDWKWRFLVTSLKDINDIDIEYKNGRGQLLTRLRMTYPNFSKEDWVNYEVNIPQEEGMNDVIFYFYDATSALIGKFEVKDYVDILIEHKLLPADSRQKYLDWKQE